MEPSAAITGGDLTVKTLLPRTQAGYSIARTRIGAAVLVPDVAAITIPEIVVNASCLLRAADEFAVTGDLTVSGSLDVAGRDVSVFGDLDVSNGNVDINAGLLTVSGAVSLSGASGTLSVGGGSAVFGSYYQFLQASNSSGLVMQNASDDVIVLGAFVSDEDNFYTGETANAFTNGTLRLRGNVSHLGGTGANGRGFAPVGTFVRLEGSSTQTVRFDVSSATQSRFGDIHIANPAGVSWASNIWVTGELTMDAAASVSGGDVTVTSLLPRAQAGYAISRTHIGVAGFVPDVTSLTLPRLVVDASRSLLLEDNFDLAGHMTVNGSLQLGGHDVGVGLDLYVNGGSVDVAGGSLAVGNDLSIDGDGGIVSVNGGTIDVGGDFYQYLLLSNSGLLMVNSADVVRIVGQFRSQMANLQDSTTEGRFTAGLLTVGGNMFTQEGIGNTGHAFVSTGTAVTFSGTTALDLGASGAGTSRLDDVRINAGGAVTQSQTNLYSSGNWTVGGTLTVPLNRTLTLAGTITVLPGATLNLSGTIFSAGCTVEPGATRTGAGAGCL